jgi:hypothetical protein
MKQVHRLSGLLGLLGLLMLSGCGGGSSASTAPAQDSFAGGGNNVVPMTVEGGPASAKPFNQPYVSVKICIPGGACGTVGGILVDTGSFGLRIMASAMTGAGITLPAMPDPIVVGNTIQECLPFADGYAWGQVSLASVSIGGETSTGSVPIQVIDDSASPSPAVPSSCGSKGNSLNSVDQLGANGILGVGVVVADCGSHCAGNPAPADDIYYSCTGTTGTCAQVSQPVASQVSNPVASFPTDNNGVILQLPSVGSAGAPMAGGYLVFGIGTEANNALGSAHVMTADNQGDITTNFNGQSLTSSFIDSGSNALFFNDSSLQLCSQTAPLNAFYCPPATASLTATNQGQNGTTTSVGFSIANLNKVDGSNFALDDVGGPAATIAGFGPYFDWGLPFFYGRTIFFALEGTTAGGSAGPYYAY